MITNKLGKHILKVNKLIFFFTLQIIVASIMDSLSQFTSCLAKSSTLEHLRPLECMSKYEFNFHSTNKINFLEFSISTTHSLSEFNSGSTKYHYIKFSHFFFYKLCLAQNLHLKIFKHFQALEKKILTYISFKILIILKIE